jgi:uncharacterized membrane protein
MKFIYIHMLFFVAWMVSLEAIFFTFILIGQNRLADFAQRKANHDFREHEQELKLNTELTRAIHVLALDVVGAGQRRWPAAALLEAADRLVAPSKPPMR